MEKQLSYVLMLSLEEMALRRIAVALYNEPYILSSIANFIFKGRVTKVLTWDVWSDNVECEITRRVSKLRLPESLTKQMIPILKAVCREILKWESTHQAYLSDSSDEFNVRILEKLCWTTAGAVDYSKTAEKLVRCDVVDIVTRFELACLYCLENYIPELWKELPKENRKTFYNEEVTSRVETPHLQLFLPYILKKQSKIAYNSFWFVSPRNSFEESALCGNKTLAEYCFWKLTKEEREASLVRTAKDVIKCRNDLFFTNSDCRKEKLSDVFCYLLSLMTPEEQIGIFKELPCEVLRCFLDWPWQDLFLDNADVIWTFLPESRYKDVVDTIYRNRYYSGYYLPNFLQNVFLCSPTEFRKHFIDLLIREHFFFEVFINKDTETFKVIFRNVDAADRVRLVSSECFLNLIYALSDEWLVMEVFLREATLSKEDKERLKEAFIELARRQKREYRDSIELVRRDYRNFFEFVEETDASALKKRSSEDETLTKTKRLL